MGTRTDRWPLLSQAEIVESIAHALVTHGFGLNVPQVAGQLESALDRSQGEKEREQQELLDKPIVIDGVTLEKGALYDLEVQTWAYGAESRSIRGARFVRTDLVQVGYKGGSEIRPVFQHFGVKPSRRFVKPITLMPIKATKVMPNAAQAEAIAEYDRRHGGV